MCSVFYMNSSHFLQLYKVGIISSFFRDEETEIESTLSIVIQVIGELSVFRVWVLYTFIACMPHCFSHVQLFAMLWTVARQALLSRLDSPGKNIGVGCHALLPGMLLTQISMSPASAGGFFTISTAWEACTYVTTSK